MRRTVQSRGLGYASYNAVTSWPASSNCYLGYPVMIKHVLSLALLSLSLPAMAAEVTVCIAAPQEKNPLYYGLAITSTQLKCELPLKYFPTLTQLYRDGWQLVQVVGVTNDLARGAKGPSPVYYLQRDARPSAPSAAKPKAPERKPESSSFGDW